MVEVYIKNETAARENIKMINMFLIVIVKINENAEIKFSYT